MKYNRLKQLSIAWFITLCWAFLPLAQSAEVVEQDTNTLFILDASGSMWGQINGKPKIAIAKEVMSKLLPELSKTSRIGLIAYGHRHKGDCSDVETLVKLGNNHRQSILNAVLGLHAKGKTPLTRSVNQAIDLLRSEKNRSTIILLSDGIESCSGNPCAAVKAAKASGVNFILHTIGFGLNSKESVQLQCMAKAGDGEYFQANNAEELLKSTRNAVKSKGSGMLKLTLRSNGKPVNAWARLSGDGSIGLVDLTNDTGVKPGHVWHLKPGTYQLETLPAGLYGIDSIKLNDIKIESGKSVEKTLDFDQTTLQVIASNNGMPAVVQINLKNLASGKIVFDTTTYSTFTMRGVKTPYDVKLLPGKYRLSVKLLTKTDLTPYTEDIDLASSVSPVVKIIDIATDILRITATKNGKTAKALIYIDDLTENRNIFNSDFLVSFGVQTPYDLRLLPGKYRLTVALPNVPTPHVEELQITSGGKVVVKNIPFEVKQITADTNGMEQNTDRPGGGDFRHVIPATDDPSLCQRACQDEPQCKAWTYVKPNTIQGAEPNCWLKSTVPTAVPNSCCVSGVN